MLRLPALSLFCLAALGPSKCIGVSPAPVSPQRTVPQMATGAGLSERQDNVSATAEICIQEGPLAATLKRAVNLLNAGNRLVFADPARMVRDGENVLLGGEEEQTAIHLQQRYGQLLAQLVDAASDPSSRQCLEQRQSCPNLSELLQLVEDLTTCLRGQGQLLDQVMRSYAQVVEALYKQRQAVDNYDAQFYQSQVALSELHAAQQERYPLQQRRDYLQSLYAMDEYLARPGSLDTLKNALQSEEEPYDDDIGVMRSLAGGLPDPLLRRQLAAAISSLQVGRIGKLPAELAQHIGAALDEYRAPSEQQLEERQRLLDDCNAQLGVHDGTIAQRANAWRMLCTSLVEAQEEMPKGDGLSAQVKRDFEQALVDFRLSEQSGREMMRQFVQCLSSSPEIGLAIQQDANLAIIFDRILGTICEALEVVASGEAIRGAVEPLRPHTANAGGHQGDSGLEAE